MVTVNSKTPKAVARSAKPAARPAASRQRKAKANGNGVAHAMASNSLGGDGLDGHEKQPTRMRSPSDAKGLSGSMLERGKDLLASEAGGVATAAAIVVGAALIEIELVPGLLIGAGAILMGKFFPQMGDYVRPVVKGAVRAGFAMTHKARAVISEANEQVQDLVAEVRHEQDKGYQAEPALQPHAPTKGAASANSRSPVH